MNQEEYIPGVCNIGKAEIERRAKKLRTVGFLLLALSIAFFWLPYARFVLPVLTSMALYCSILIFQIRQRFCILFGWHSVFNFKDLNTRYERIDEPEAREKDRFQVYKILLYSLFTTSLYLFFMLYLMKIMG